MITFKAAGVHREMAVDEGEASRRQALGSGIWGCVRDCYGEIVRLIVDFAQSCHHDNRDAENNRDVWCDSWALSLR